MPLLSPFRGMRPPRDFAAKLACPPYDVVSAVEARAMAAGRPESFFHISRPEIDLPPDTDEHADAVYLKGLENLRAFEARGWLKQDGSEHFYLYRQKMGEHEQTGLVAVAGVDAYDDGRIKKHELTRQDKEDDRTRHIEALRANDEPVFLTYRANPNVDALVTELTQAPPESDFTADDGVQHTFWVIPTAQSARVAETLEPIHTLYIADGHHRSAAASRVHHRLSAERGGHGRFLVVAFPHDQMQVLAYNRVVKDLHGLTPEAFGEQLREKFDFKVGSSRPSHVHQFGMFLDGQWYRLTARPHSFDATPTGVLDVTILQKNVLEPLLGIADPRSDGRIAFVGGIRGTDELEKLVSSRAHRVAFSLFPTTLEQLMAIADVNGMMPPKSTWFEPKLRSGLVVHPF